MPVQTPIDDQLRQLDWVAGTFGSLAHGLLHPLCSGGCDTERPLTSAYPLRSICRSISGDVEAMVIPRGIALPAFSHGRSSVGRLSPVSFTVNPNSSGVFRDWKICSGMQSYTTSPHTSRAQPRLWRDGPS